MTIVIEWHQNGTAVLWTKIHQIYFDFASLYYEEKVI